GLTRLEDIDIDVEQRDPELRMFGNERRHSVADVTNHERDIVSTPFVGKHLLQLLDGNALVAGTSDESLAALLVRVEFRFRKLAKDVESDERTRLLRLEEVTEHRESSQGGALEYSAFDERTRDPLCSLIELVERQQLADAAWRARQVKRILV